MILGFVRCLASRRQLDRVVVCFSRRTNGRTNGPGMEKPAGPVRGKSWRFLGNLPRFSPGVVPDDDRIVLVFPRHGKLLSADGASRHVRRHARRWATSPSRATKPSCVHSSDGRQGAFHLRVRDMMAGSAPEGVRIGSRFRHRKGDSGPDKTKLTPTPLPAEYARARFLRTGIPVRAEAEPMGSGSIQPVTRAETSVAFRWSERPPRSRSEGRQCDELLTSRS